MEIFERIKHLRKNQLSLTQEDFAKKIKISRSNLASIETGRIALTERVISDICREFLVNDTWLRTGSGEIFIVLDETEKEDAFIASFMKDSNELKKKIIMGLYQLDDRFWDDMVEKIKEIASDTYE